MTKLRTTFYLQLTPNRYNALGEVIGVRAEAITQNRPRRPTPGAVVVAFTVRVPAHIFAPLATVNIDIPEEAMQVVPEVEVGVPEA